MPKEEFQSTVTVRIFDGETVQIENTDNNEQNDEEVFLRWGENSNLLLSFVPGKFILIRVRGENGIYRFHGKVEFEEEENLIEWKCMGPFLDLREVQVSGTKMGRVTLQTPKMSSATFVTGA